MPNCKPGDLAVVIRGPNSGAFVDVIAPVDNPIEPGMVAWVCTSRSPVTCNLLHPFTGQCLDERLMPPGSEVCFFDADLQPIRPPARKATLPDRELEVPA